MPGQPESGSDSFNPSANASIGPTSSLAIGPSVFDQFQLAQCTPLAPKTTAFHTDMLEASHPMMAQRLESTDTANLASQNVSGESPAERLMMYRVVEGMLKGKQKDVLAKLRDRGVLDDYRTEDGHSTLYHLYAMVTTPRQPGYRPAELLKETVDILEKPYVITQHFTPLADNAAKQIMGLRMHPNLDPQAGRIDPQSQRPLKWEELNVDASATCVASSVMYSMAQKEPGELTRQLNELTSPLNAFYEHAKFSEVSPDNPSQAPEILKHNSIPYKMVGPDDILVKVTLPTAGVIRAINDQKSPANHKDRDAIESAYQSALMHLATPTYDPATDLRSEIGQPNQTSKGLTEEEKSLMESIIKDSGAIQSVTYQVFSGKQNPAPGEQGTPLHYGYQRTFQQTANDMIRVLQKNQFIIVGTTDTNKDGSLAGGHEVTLTQAFVDEKTHELKFVVADSDDDIPKLVVRSAREIIPKIHHAGMPVDEARAIKQQEQQLPGPLVPDASDAKAFDLISFYSPNPFRQNA
jgi:hypothetical protein